LIFTKIKESPISSLLQYLNHFFQNNFLLIKFLTIMIIDKESSNYSFNMIEDREYQSTTSNNQTKTVKYNGWILLFNLLFETLNNKIKNDNSCYVYYIIKIMTKILFYDINYIDQFNIIIQNDKKLQDDKRVTDLFNFQFNLFIFFTNNFKKYNFSSQILNEIILFFNIYSKRYFRNEYILYLIEKYQLN
jgi:hypothetical protein